MQHVGIDIGKSQLDVCPSLDGTPARAWPVYRLDYSIPGWDAELRRLVPAGAVVTVESTGWHYLSPVLQALRSSNCTIWQVPTTTTGKIRTVHVSGGKSDSMDARALAVAANWISWGEVVRGAYPFSQEDQIAVSDLRAQVNALQRIKKERTRALNRLDQLGHAIWPTLPMRKDTWLRAVQAGAITPDELRDLAALSKSELKDVSGYEHGASHAPLRRLVAELPDFVIAPAAVAQNIEAIAAHLPDLDAQEAEAEQKIAALLQTPTFAARAERWLMVPESSMLAVAAVLVASNARAESYSVNEFKTAVGTAPNRARSGSIDRRGKGKPGYRPAMVALWFWTMRLIKSETPNPVQDYNAALTARNHRHAFRASIGKLARVLHGVAKSEVPYTYPLDLAYTEVSLG